MVSPGIKYPIFTKNYPKYSYYAKKPPQFGPFDNLSNTLRPKYDGSSTKLLTEQ